MSVSLRNALEARSSMLCVSGLRPSSATVEINFCGLADAHTAINEIQKFCAGPTANEPTQAAYDAACRALHWRTAELRANGIEPMKLTDDMGQYPPEDYHLVNRRVTAETIGLTKFELENIDELISVFEILGGDHYDTLWNLRNRIKPFEPGDKHFDAEE